MKYPVRSDLPILGSQNCLATSQPPSRATTPFLRALSFSVSTEVISQEEVDPPRARYRTSIPDGDLRFKFASRTTVAGGALSSRKQSSVYGRGWSRRRLFCVFHLRRRVTSGKKRMRTAKKTPRDR
uniref:Uncharacterized protein n=1 Tax=Steinernema glaseri TaxID=37863 RepID=A0A1I8AJ16_9BILA